MSFSYKKDKDWWEIERGCPGSNNVVVGGVSKLFTHFVRRYNPSQVFSYCDNNKFNGVGYEKIGMEYIGNTGPDMKWVLNGVVYNRNPKKHKYFKDNKAFQIYGAGSKKYLWKKK